MLLVLLFLADYSHFMKVRIRYLHKIVTYSNTTVRKSLRYLNGQHNFDIFELKSIISNFQKFSNIIVGSSLKPGVVSLITY